MPTVEYFDIEKNRRGTTELPDALFAAEVNEHLLHEIVRMQRARKRAGTACTKQRPEVSGGGKKPYRQKGSGRARQGSRRSPIHVGGAAVFGPRPRSYDFLPPARVRRAALLSALSRYCRDGRIVVLSDFELAQGKTKAVGAVMDRFGLGSALVVDEKGNENLFRGIRNLAGFSYLPPEGLNVYDVLRHGHLVLTLKGVEGIQGRLSTTKGRKKAVQPC